jgi:hypothetical protein
MHPLGNDEIAQLLRLKRYEQPPASYYGHFLSEFRRRQRDQLLRQSVLTICLERAQNFVFRLDVRSLAPYPAAIATVLVCGAVVSIRIYQQLEPAQVTLQSSPGFDQATDYGQRIGLRASRVHSSFRHAAGCSPCKQQGYSNAASAAG